MKKLAAFEDTQTAMYLLRASCGIIRANHFMRTTPLPQWSQHAKKFDELARSTRLKTVMTADSYEQACVSTRSGGFGIRRVRTMPPAAFNASWFAGKTRCGEDWTAPVPNMTSSASSQSEASKAIDKSIMSRLLESADRRNKQRLNRLAPTRGLLRCPPKSMARRQSCPQRFILPLHAAFSASCHEIKSLPSLPAHHNG
jgi:hypothetical protein